MRKFIFFRGYDELGLLQEVTINRPLYQNLNNVNDIESLLINELSRNISEEIDNEIIRNLTQRINRGGQVA